MIQQFFKSVVFIVLLVISSNIQIYAQTCATYQAANSTPDAGCDQVLWVTSTADNTTAGTLRWAIISANSWTGTGTSIRFCINTPGEIVFQLVSGLPTIVKRVVIDGSKNITYTNQLIIAIQGNKTNVNSLITLYSGSNGSTIKNLILRNSVLDGISIQSFPNCGAINDISIIGNSIYNVGLNFGTYIDIEGNFRNYTIYKNILGGYLDLTGQFIPFYNNTTWTQAILLRVSCAQGASDIKIGSGNSQDANIIHINNQIVNMGDLLVSGSGQSPPDASMDKISFKYNKPYVQRTPDKILTNIADSYTLAALIKINNNKKSPVITSYNGTNKIINGTSSPNDRVEVYCRQVNESSLPLIPLKYLGVTTANASGQWSLPSTAWENPGLELFNNDIIDAIADSLGNSSDFSNPFVYITCPILGFTLPTVACKNGGSITLAGSPSGGTFSGAGVTGSTFNPVNVTAGLVNITYTYTNVPAGLGCSTTVSKQILIPPLATILNNVINISAGTNNDAWPVDGSVRSSTLGYGTTGIKFMWAPEESYAYVDNRVQTNTLVTPTDGLLQGVPMFNWMVTAANSCYANWRKINTITQINSGTGQLENRDILNNYSAALYGYKDQLSTAIASNASYKEIAFDSFEEYALGMGLDLSSISKSNLTVVNTSPSVGSLAQELNFEYDIVEARDKVITMNYPYSSIAQLVGKRVGIFGAFLIVQKIFTDIMM